MLRHEAGRPTRLWVALWREAGGSASRMLLSCAFGAFPGLLPVVVENAADVVVCIGCAQVRPEGMRGEVVGVISAYRGKYGAMLEVSGVRVGDGEAPAVRQASLHVGEGELVTLVGGAGSGKTAMLQALSGLRSVSAGSICFGGVEITRLPAAWRAELGMAFVPAGGDLWLEQTVHENLILGAYGRRSRRVRAESLERVYGLFPRMEGFAGRSASELSESEQRTLAIARALMSQPRLVLLDEPGPEALGVIEGLNAEGIGILLAQRNAIDRGADRMYAMDSGAVRQRR